MLLLAALLVATPADRRLELKVGTPLIERVEPGTLFVETDGPGLHAELLASGELLLEARKPGLSRVFLFSKRLVRVYLVAVGVPLPPEGPGGCAPVVDAKSYDACRARIGPGEKVVFEPEGLQAQAKAAQVELDRALLPQVSAGFTPYGLRLKGARDEPERRRALRAIWPLLLGPLRLDDP